MPSVGAWHLCGWVQGNASTHVHSLTGRDLLHARNAAWWLSPSTLHGNMGTTESWASKHQDELLVGIASTVIGGVVLALILAAAKHIPTTAWFGVLALPGTDAAVGASLGIWFVLYFFGTGLLKAIRRVSGDGVGGLKVTGEIYRVRSDPSSRALQPGAVRCTIVNTGRKVYVQHIWLQSLSRSGRPSVPFSVMRPEPTSEDEAQGEQLGVDQGSRRTFYSEHVAPTSSDYVTLLMADRLFITTQDGQSFEAAVRNELLP